VEKKIIRLEINEELAFVLWFALFFGSVVVLVIWGR
jgi:hypothetical protein